MVWLPVAVWPWANYLSNPRLQLSIYKMGILVITLSYNFMLRLLHLVSPTFTHRIFQSSWFRSVPQVNWSPKTQLCEITFPLSLNWIQLRDTAGYLRMEGEWSEYLPFLLQTERSCPHPPPPNLYVDNLIFNVIIFGGETFGKKLGHEGGAFINDISPLIKEGPESSLTSSTTWAHSRWLSMKQETGPPQTVNLPVPW